VPTIVDSLIVKLGIDGKDMDSKSSSATKKLADLEGQSGKTEKGVKKIGETSKSSASGVETLTRSLGSFLALIGGTAVLKAFVEDTIASNAALDRFAKNLGMSVSDVSAWGNAVEELGGSAKGAQGTLDMLSKAQTELRLTGQSSLIPYLSALGVAMSTVGGQARPVDEILLDLSERFSHMDRTTANNMGRMMGIDQDTMNLLLKGRTEVELTLKRQKEYNAVTKEQAEESSKLQRSMVDLKQSFAALGRDLLQQASPAIEKFLSVLQSFGGWIRENKEFVADFLTVMAVGLGAIALVTLPITGTVAAVTALGAAIALLWQDYQTWKRGGDSFVDWQVWKDRIDAVTNSIQKLRNALSGIEDKTEKFLEKSPTYKKFNDWFVNKGDAKKLSSSVGGALGSALGVRPGKMSLEQAIGKVEGFNAKGSKPNRPQRNHNPGDIEYGKFARDNGATGTDGRFAIFPDDSTGFSALSALLKTSGYSSLSVEQAIGKFAPPEENDTAKYVRDVTRSTGLKATDILSGIQGASSSVAAAGASPSSSSSTTDKSVTVQTGDINIHTQATDANGIARDMGKSMDFLFTSQANSGLF
jgi:hypothetical protein